MKRSNLIVGLLSVLILFMVVAVFKAACNVLIPLIIAWLLMNICGPFVNDLAHRKVPLAKAVLVCGLALGATLAHGTPILQDDALARAREWMTGHPIMSDAAERPVQSVETLTSSEGFSIYVAGFWPQGYVVLNSDDRLPLVVSFSADTLLDLSDDPQNTFRKMLQLYVDDLAARLAKATEEPTATVSQATILAETEQYGPFLNSKWNQTKPYNLFCPSDPMGNSYYGYRTPSGCVPTAFAQITHFYQWPPSGKGSFSYTDAGGQITGNHSADFSDPYDWTSMQDQYFEYKTNPPAAEIAVSELVYELGVAAETDYESDGSGAIVSVLGDRLSTFFYYDFEYSGQLPFMDSQLQAGYPCVASISSHAIAVDGLLSDNGTKTYHINYGWGGMNDGWYNASSISSGRGIALSRPGLVAVPVTNSLRAVEGHPFMLEWIAPTRRTNEIARLEIKRLTQKSDNWFVWEPFAEDMEPTVRPKHEVENNAPDGQTVFLSYITAPVAGTYTLGTSLVDTSGQSRNMDVSPTFTLTVIADSMADTDGDGMPDSWEILHGLNVGTNDGALDPDQDGFSNYAEYVSGTDPDNIGSRWRIELDSDGLPVFPAAENRLYTILYSTNLLNASWVPLATGIIGINEPLSIYDYDDPMSQTSRFYRVQVTMPE
ncbi:MAG: C10 family peptidase [Pontiellaceae bacterium]|nr:C10 family peptidase [Pontiellaceae bacterium]